MLHVLRRNKYREIQLKSKDANQAYYWMIRTINETSMPIYLNEVQMEKCVNRSILFNELGIWKEQYFEIRSHLVRSYIKSNRFRSPLQRWNKVCGKD